MIGILLALVAAAGPPADAPAIKCVFAKAGELAETTSKGRQEIADQVARTCGAGGGAAGLTEAAGSRLRAAALAVVDRKRGTDGMPADAPIRLPDMETRVVGGRLDIPDEIAPAVVPYVGCLMASRGVQVRGGHDPTPDGAKVGTDCAPYRREAASKADILLKRIGGRSARQRAALIEKTLAAADEFAKPPLMLPKAGKRPDASN